MVDANILFIFQEWIDLKIKEDLNPIFRFVPKILLAVAIPVLDGLYGKIAFWLNDLG